MKLHCRLQGRAHLVTTKVKTRTGSFRLCPVCGHRWDRRTTLAGPSA